LLPLIFLVMPGHVGLDLVQVHVLAVQQHLTEYALISIVVVVIHYDRLAGDQIREVLLRPRAKCLTAFWRIDTLQTDLVRASMQGGAVRFYAASAPSSTYRVAIPATGAPMMSNASCARM
jgi:hypothetical protein